MLVDSSLFFGPFKKCLIGAGVCVSVTQRCGQLCRALLLPYLAWSDLISAQQFVSSRCLPFLCLCKFGSQKGDCVIGIESLIVGLRANLCFPEYSIASNLLQFVPLL